METFNVKVKLIATLINGDRWEPIVDGQMVIGYGVATNTDPICIGYPTEYGTTESLLAWSELGEIVGMCQCRRSFSPGDLLMFYEGDLQIKV